MRLIEKDSRSGGCSRSGGAVTVGHRFGDDPFPERDVVKFERPVGAGDGSPADHSQQRRRHVRDQENRQPGKPALPGIEQAVSVRILETGSRNGARARRARNEPPKIDSARETPPPPPPPPPAARPLARPGRGSTRPPAEAPAQSPGSEPISSDSPFRLRAGRCEAESTGERR
jgi:hypothetical protein